MKTFTFLEEGTTKVTATPIKWKEGKVRLCIPVLFLYQLVLCSFYFILFPKTLYLNMKGVPNGVNHEKKGNKRPPADIRLVSKYVRVST